MNHEKNIILINVEAYIPLQNATLPQTKVQHQFISRKLANILNGLNFARKVIATQECDFLVLDEILGLLDKHIATVDMVVGLLKQKDESMHLILTGNRVDPGILDYVDSVTTITTLGREQNS